jgi:hypothetical protein
MLARFDTLDRGVADINRAVVSRDKKVDQLATSSDRLERRVADLEAWVHRNDPSPDLRPVASTEIGEHSDHK